jgi:hypothetical protein
MGDSLSLGELRGFLVAVVFISLFVALVAWIPYQFVYTTAADQKVELPTSAHMSDYLLYNVTAYLVNFSDPLYHLPGEVGIWQTTFLLGSHTMGITANNSTSPYTATGQFYCFWQWTAYDWRTYTWKIGSSEYDILHYADLDSLGNTGSLEFVLSEQGSGGADPFTIVFVWDNVSYATPSAACDADHMTLLIGKTLDQMQTKSAGINLIASLLLFNLPNVHPYINYILGLITWALIAILIVTIIRSFIPLL